MGYAWLLMGIVLASCLAGCGSSASGPVKTGDPAPDFTLRNAKEESVQLAQFRGRVVVLFFYPKDASRICTREVCLFRDSYEVFQAAGATLLGVSSDTTKSHEDFAKAQRLPYLLLADEGGIVRARYGVPKTMGVIPGRVTYVIDKMGVVRHVFNSQFQAEQHVEEALRVVRELGGATTPKP